MSGPLRPVADLPDRHGELAVGWALHALEPDQEAEFLAHLVGCRLCEQVVAETTATLEQLARAVPEVEPPAGLRRRILAEAGDAPVATAPAADDPTPSRPRRAAHTSDPDPATDVINLPIEQLARPKGLAPVVPLWRRMSTRVVAAAAAVAVVVAIGGLVATNRSLRDQQAAQAASAAQTDRVVRVLQDAGAPGSRHATLATSSGSLVGLVVVDGNAGPTVLTTGLSTNRTDQTYVLWGLSGDTPVGLGAFDVSGSSPSIRAVPLVGPAAPFAGYAVSLEPGRTVPAAPTDVVASGKVGT